jgi:hypothetical protein
MRIFAKKKLIQQQNNLLSELLTKESCKVARVLTKNND